MTLGLAGCGSGAHALCERAAECDYIGNSDVDECTDDIRNAVADGDLDRSQVRECLRCAHDNECGLDMLLDCAKDCDEVSGYVFASNF